MRVPDSAALPSPSSSADGGLTAALLLSGGALAALSWVTIAATELAARRPPAVLLALGGLLFGVGVFLGGAPGRPAWLARRLMRPADYLGVTPPQLVLLVAAPAFAVLARLAAGDGALARQPAAATLSWLLGIGCAWLGARRRDGRSGRIPRREIALIALLFGGALVARAAALDAIPTTLSGDEASAGFSSLDFLNGKADNLFAIGWFSFPSLFYALNSVGIVLFGRTAEGLRLLAALAGAATVVGLYGLARALFDRPTAVIASAVLLASHHHIHFSRIGLQNVWDGLFTVLALAAFWHGWRTERRSGLLLSGFLLGLGQYFYVTFRAMPLVVLIWSLASAVWDWNGLRRRLPALALAAWLAIATYLPLALYFIAQPQEFNAPLQRVTVFEGWLTEQAARTGRSELGVLWQQIGVSAAGVTHRPLEHWYNVGKPLLLSADAALFLLGLIWTVIAFRPAHLLIWLPMLVVVLAGAFSRDAPASQRYVMLGPLAALLIAVPIAQIGRRLAAQWPRWRPAVWLAAAVLVAGLMAGNLRFYFGEVYDGYVLGGYNTETAVALADYLQPGGAQTVYFFGWPRMGYSSIASLPFLAPQSVGRDVMEPLTGPPDVPLDGPTLFIFLPERLDELALVQAAFPGGALEKVTRERDDTLYFAVYRPPQ